MLSILNPLYFPRLVRIGQANFKAWSDNSKMTPLYKLDWSQIEKIKEKEFKGWAKNHANIDTKYVGDLPKEYDEWLKNFTFAIPDHYLTKIHAFARQGLEGWTTRYPFDTNIRELCLKPAISAVEVSFKLIADCPYDKQTNYFYRGDDKIIIAHATLYKFWCFQTGRGCIEDHANFQRLEFISKCEDTYNGTPKEPSKMKKEVDKFLIAIKKHNKILDKAYALSTETPPTGPSLAEEKN